MPLIMETYISQMAATATRTGPYPFTSPNLKVSAVCPHECHLCGLEATLTYWRRLYISRRPKGRSRKVFKNKISVANCDHLFER